MAASLGVGAALHAGDAAHAELPQPLATNATLVAASPDGSNWRAIWREPLGTNPSREAHAGADVSAEAADTGRTSMRKLGLRN